MFLLELLNFSARILLMIITLCCMLIIGTGKSLIHLTCAIVTAIRQRKANKQFSDDVDALGAEYLKYYLLDDPVQPQLSDEEIKDLVGQADSLIHYGGQSVKDVAAYLAAKYEIPGAVIEQVLMAAEAHNISKNQKGDDDVQ
jgi:hypothetical protein